MSVLNQSGEEQVECPLCMEPLEVDDLNFYPCTCGYQICRFCWHRIRTDENGLCPACRKAYSENPADFTPLSKEQVAQLKAEKRQRDQQRKAKLSESRKHLASVRVVQKNLVFVVGLPVRLADADVLKRHEYFGKFGKIHKVVINQSTSYAGSQGPSASAYVTYVKSDDALRAIQNVNNIMLDGRLIKSSLGTTKYCSHFMKNQQCPKPDCMYLHDFGDPEASFTKEQMHQGKHQEYEKKLHDALLNRTAQQQSQTIAQNSGGTVTSHHSSPPVSIGNSGGSNNREHNDRKEQAKGRDTSATNQAKDSSWPTLSGSSASSSSGSSTDSGFGSKSEKSQKSESKSEKNQKGNKGNQKNKNNNNSSNNNNNNVDKKSDKNQVIKQHCEQNSCQQQQNNQQNSQTHSSSAATDKTQHSKSNTKESGDTTTSECIDNLSKMQLIDDNSSFFSHNTFQKILPDQDSSSYSTDSSSVTPHSNILNDNLPDINSSEDWQAAFGFSKKSESPLEQSELSTSNSIVSETNFGSTQNNYDRSDNFKLEQSYLSAYQKTQNFSEKSRDILEELNRSQFPLKLENDLLNSSSHNPPFVNLKNNVNGLDQQMSKFFAEFKNHQKDITYNGFSNNGLIQNDRSYSQLLNESDQLLLLNQYQQRQLEEQAMFNLKQSLLLNQRQQQQQFLQNHTALHHGQNFLANGTDHYVTQNGQYANGGGFTQNSVFQNQSLQRQALRGDRPSVDDDLGFDPFHETQKALAELIESEQTVSQIQNSGLLNQNSVSAHTSNGAPPNGLLHSGGVSNSGHLPPPPPGFLQHNTHMNSFGSKILPFLNMSNSQQISSPGGWTTNYSEAQLKGLAPVNDWTTLDPAIVSSSRHFPLVNLQPVREQYSPFQQLPNQQNPQLRGFEFQNNSFTNSYTNQHNMQQNYSNNGYSHINTQHNGLNWYNSELQNQISSPPGFRQTTVAQTKTQEC